MTAVLSLIGTFIGFQLTRSRGAWPQKNSPKAVIKIISTHTLTWSVTGLWWNCRFLWQFQLTRSRGAWLLSSEYIYFYNDFNSHAHVERDRLKVATLQLMKGISTHTLTWSVTADPKSNSRSYGYFNSHAHVERDHKLIDPHWQLFISTHTLTWSVTQARQS